MGKDNIADKSKIFKDFSEYWNFVKCLSEDQKVLIADSLSKTEQNHLRKSYEKEGWHSLMMRNLVDKNLDIVKKNFKIDLLEVKTSIFFKKPYLIDTKFWNYIIGYFKDIPYEHISYIFDGIKAEPYDKKFTKLTKK